MDGEQTYPLTRAQIKQQRTQREKARILSILAGIDFDRREIQSELKKAQSIYARKLEMFTAQMQKVSERERSLLTQVSRLMQDAGLCFAFSLELATHKDQGHNFHTCGREFAHEGRHHCQCGEGFSAEVVSHA